MNFRDWLIIIGLTVIAGLVADAARRLWIQRRIRNEITFGLKDVKGQEACDDYTSELPNGGARVRSADGQDFSAVPHEPWKQDNNEHPAHRAGILDEKPEVFKNDLGQNLQDAEENRVSAQYLDSENISDSDSHESEQPFSQAKSGHCNDSFSLQLMPVSETIVPSENESHNDDVMTDSNNIVTSSIRQHDEEEQNISPSPELKTGHNTSRNKMAHEMNHNKTKSTDHHDSESPRQHASTDMGDILVMHVEARKNQSFSGDELLQLLLDNGLRHGDMNIFHYIRKSRYQPENTLFSVANGMEPGNFNLKTMRQERFHVLTFMMFLSGPESPVEAFRTMVDTVDVVSRYLFADVKDENRCIMTLQMLEYYRERVLEFQRMQMLEQHTG